MTVLYINFPMITWLFPWEKVFGIAELERLYSQTYFQKNKLHLYWTCTVFFFGHYSLNNNYKSSRDDSKCTGDVCRLYAHVCHFLCETWASADFGVLGIFTFSVSSQTFSNHLSSCCCFRDTDSLLCRNTHGT